MLSHLRDLMKHTSGLGIGVIKVTGENGVVKVEGMDDNKSVVLKGRFKKEIPEFEGVFGLSRLDYLSKIVNVYKEKGDTVEVLRREKTYSMPLEENGELVVDEDNNQVYEKVTEEVIEEFTFSRKTPKMVNPYRVIDRRQIPEQYSFLGKDWDVVIKPKRQAIELLATQAAFGVEEFFGVETKDSTLYLTLGDSSSQAIVEFAQEIEGDMVRPWTWPVAPVLSILKFSDTAECTMSFLDKGALQITLDTGLAEYNYIMPAKAR